MPQWYIRQVLDVIPCHTRSNHLVFQIIWRYCDRRFGTHRKVVILWITPTRVLFTHKGGTLIIILSFCVVVLLSSVSPVAWHQWEVFRYAVYLIPTVYSQVIIPFPNITGIRRGCSHYTVYILVVLPEKDDWCWVYTSPPLAYLQMSSLSGPGSPNEETDGRISIWGNLNYDLLMLNDD